MVKNFKKEIDNLPDEISTLIKRGGQEADALGMKAFLVGGLVRDLELGKVSWDVDIAVEGEGVRLSERLKENIGGRLVIYRKFGTATLFIKGIRIDIATARREIYREPAALPEVFFSTLKEDLMRRDFTMNAIAVNINEDTFGRVEDPFNGLNDINRKLIRVLHEKSFLDDPTRIFRAVRFEQRLKFRIEKQTLSLIKKARDKKMISRLKKKRIMEELKLFLKEDSKEEVLLRMQEVYGFDFMESYPGKTDSKQLEKHICKYLEQ